MRWGHLRNIFVLIGVGLFSTSSSAAVLLKIERTESYRLNQSLSQPSESGDIQYKAEQIFWLEAESPDKTIVYLKDPLHPNDAARPMMRSDFNSYFSRHLPVSKVERDLRTRDNATIKKGAVLVEESFDRDNVWVSIEGDRSGSIYRVSRTNYLGRGALTPLHRNAVESTLNTDNTRYELLTPFTKLVPAQDGLSPIDLGKGDVVEVIDEGREGSWAKKVRIVNGPHANEEYLMSAKLLENPSAAKQISGNSPASDKKNSSPQVVVDQSNTQAEPQTPQNNHGSGRAGQNLLGKSTINGVAIDPLSNPAQCTERRGNDKRSLHPDKTRSPFKNDIINAANEYDIHPAILEASIHLETDFRADLENTGEKNEAKRVHGPVAAAEAALVKNNSDVWGKGLCQFGPSAAKQYGLNWRDPKPTSFPVSAQYRRSYPKSVWNPSACIMAKAAYMKRFVDREDLFITLANGQRYDLKDYLFSRGPENSARALLSFFNRGNRYVNSLQAYYSRHGKLPSEYGQAWAEPVCKERAPACRPPQKGSTLMLNSQAINRRHVLNGAGLCNPAPDNSFFAAYSKSYSYSESAGWRSR